jgi:O-antigen ligase
LEFVGLGWYIVKTKPTLSAITYPLSLGVLYTSFIAITQFFLQHSIGGLLWYLGERTFSADTPGIARISWCLIPGSWCRELLRPYATFPHPNVLGGFLAVTLPLIIFNFQFEIINQKKKFSILKLAPIILGIIALLLTFSRSAWMVGALGLLLLGRYSLRSRKVFSFVLGAIAIGLLLFAARSVYTSLPVESESIAVRQQLNAAALAIWQQSPIFGVGLGNFLVELPRVLVSREVYFLQPAHNIYLLILAEMGLVGLGVFLWILTQSLKKWNVPELHIFHISLLVLLVLGLVDHYPITLQQGQLLLTLFVGLSLALAQESRKRRTA